MLKQLKPKKLKILTHLIKLKPSKKLSKFKRKNKVPNLNQNLWKGNWNDIKDKKVIFYNLNKFSSIQSNKILMHYNNLNQKEIQ